MEIEIKKVFQLACLPLAVLILSKILFSFGAPRIHSYITVDGLTYTVSPYKSIPLKTVLDKQGIKLNPGDIVSSNILKPVKPLQDVKIIRVTKESKKITENVPFRMTWSRKYNSNLRKSELQKGIEKSITKRVMDTYYDGVLHDRQILNERSVAKEYYRLALIGKDHKIEKLYDLSKAKRMKMVATAYYPGDPLAWGDGTVTFLGQKMQRGIVAVDPEVIPLKTRLFVSGYGYGYAGDTGNLIKGNRVDLGVNNVEEEQAWMFRDVTVYILEPSSTW